MKIFGQGTRVLVPLSACWLCAQLGLCVHRGPRQPTMSPRGGVSHPPAAICLPPGEPLGCQKYVPMVAGPELGGVGQTV